MSMLSERTERTLIVALAMAVILIVAAIAIIVPDRKREALANRLNHVLAETTAQRVAKVIYIDCRGPGFMPSDPKACVRKTIDAMESDFGHSFDVTEYVLRLLLADVEGPSGRPGKGEPGGMSVVSSLIE